VCQQELDKVTAVLARSTSTKLYKGVETNFSLLDISYSKWPVEHALEFRPLHHETLYIICNGIRGKKICNLFYFRNVFGTSGKITCQQYEISVTDM